MIVEKEYKSEGRTKSLDIHLSNGDDVRIYDDGDGYCTILVDRHEDFSKKTTNSEVRSSHRIVKLPTTSEVFGRYEAGRICKVKEININSNVVLSDSTNIQVRHFDWE